MLLVRTPAPKRGESLVGYLLRVTEANGYDSPATVLAAAELSPRWKGRQKIDLAKLESVLNLQAGRLQSIGCTPQEATPATHGHLLGHRVSRAVLTGAGTRICPLCVKGRGFIEAMWDMNLMTACPRHRCKTTTACSECNSPLSMMRPGPLTCQCGADLGQQPSPPAPDEICALTAVLSGIVLGNGKNLHPTNGMPLSDLSAMSLRTITTAIATLGAFSLGRAAKGSAPELLMMHAAAALTDWPNGFHALLRKTGSRSLQDRASFRRQFATLYEGLFKRGLPASETHFLRQKLMEFGLQEWGAGTIDRRMLRDIDIPGEIRYRQSFSQMAKELGVAPTTAKRMVQKGLIPIDPLPCDSTQEPRTRNLVALSLPPKGGRILGQREAAAFIGLPVSVLLELRSSGHYTVRHVCAPIRSFNEADLIAFRTQALDRAMREAQGNPLRDQHAEMTLGHALKTIPFGGAAGKAALVAAILQGQLKPVHATADDLPGIVLRAEDVLGFAQDARAEAEGQTRSIREAAKRLGCDREAIPWLTQNGHLEWVQGSLGCRVTVTSLDRFVSSFVPLATLARSLGTSARWLRSECDRRGIGLVEAQRHRCRSIQCFIGRPDAKELTAHISPRSLP